MAGLTLAKGGDLSLSKAVPGLRAVTVGLGWDAQGGAAGVEFDLDASAFGCHAGEEVVDDDHFVFYNNLTSPDGSIQHTGDALTGGADGDDEQINVALAAVPGDVDKIVFAVSIHEGEERRQNFGQVRNAFIRVVDRDGGAEVARYDLSEDAALETGMVFGELYRDAGEWKFRAVGEPVAGGLAGVARRYGVDV